MMLSKALGENVLLWSSVRKHTDGIRRSIITSGLKNLIV